MKRLAGIGCATLLAGVVTFAQQPPASQPAPASPATGQPAAPRSRPQSPEGTAATQVNGTATVVTRGNLQLASYTGGKWIEITYGRPIKRGRDVFGRGADYAKLLLVNDATVWRAGANVTTRINSEVPLSIAGKTMPAGEYSVFIDTKSPTDWTLIVSNWPRVCGNGFGRPVCRT